MNVKRLLRLFLEFFVQYLNRPTFQLLSGEVILLAWGRNGGAVVALRSAWISAWVTGGAVSMCKRQSTCPDLATLVTWYGAAFGAIFFGLHGRFASQWAYLASVYNQIKQAEITISEKDEAACRSLAEWKAGFIEDCVELHLAAKDTFSWTIRTWLEQPNVAQIFTENYGNDARVREIIGLLQRGWGRGGSKRGAAVGERAAG